MMKNLIWILRIATGLLFIFSGLVKAIDPLGLAYKMQEFFEAWGQSGFVPSMMSSLGNHALQFSIMMITLEVSVGVALIVGWKPKITSTVLLALMTFFTFLTAYVLYSGKVKTCGCFGDCIPLTPMQTFVKDIILLVFAFVLLLKNKYILPISRNIIGSLIVLLAALCTLFLQFHVLKYLPLIDCLPFKKGNNIATLSQMPANAVADEFAINFVYEKNGQQKEFAMTELPDSSWTFVKRNQILVKAGSNNLPVINDFKFSNAAGDDMTATILESDKKYLLLFIKEVPSNYKKWTEQVKLLSQNKERPLYVVTSQRENVSRLLKQEQIEVADIFVTDGTAIKTAARVNPTIMEMNGSVIMDKQSWPNFSKLK